MKELSIYKSINGNLMVVLVLHTKEELHVIKVNINFNYSSIICILINNKFQRFVKLGDNTRH